MIRQSNNSVISVSLRAFLCFSSVNILLGILSSLSLAQSVPKVALIDFSGDSDNKLRAAVLAGVTNFEQVDGSQSRAAAHGSGYNGGLNLSRDEARDLGTSIGCDFYFLGRTWTVRRLGPSSEPYFESSTAVFLVETRSGRLLLFDLATATSPMDRAAFAEMHKLLRSRSASYAEAIKAAFQKRVEDLEKPQKPLEDEIEVLDGAVTSTSIAAPVFFQRLKPEYTSDAALANVTATVEVRAVFATDGKASELEVERWAGFGLDESALATVRALRFKPASRDGRAIAVRALVRYNFVKPPSAAEREAEQERLRRSLRQIGKP
jgi:TonB family protein